MLAHSNALKQLKSEAQRVHDFIIVTCHAVPAYKQAHKEFAEKKRPFIPRPDHFPKGTISNDRVREIAKDYKTPLANYSLLSLFAFFESYVKDVIRELLDFHGDAYLSSLQEKLRFKAVEISRSRPHKKLRERPKPESRGKYLHLIKELNSLPNSVTPTALFASFGEKMIRERMGSDFDKLKSVEIPKLLREAFLYQFSEANESTFTSIRRIRNSIAHGKHDGNLSLGNVIDYNYFLRTLAVDIDRHLLTHFFVIENV